MVFFLGTNSFPFAQTSPDGTNPNCHALELAIRQAYVKIRVDVMSGKMTSAQAQTFINTLIQIHQEELQYRAQNGTIEITSVQAGILNTLLATVTP